MKTLLSMLLIAFISVATAQEKRGKMSDISPDQMAELQTKKMALTLDLNEAQQRDLLKLNKELVKKRMQKKEKYKALKEKGEKLSSEERFKLMNAQLDERLEVQQRMKKVLSEEQYKKWRKMSAMRAQKKKALKKRQMQRKRRGGW